MRVLECDRLGRIWIQSWAMQNKRTLPGSSLLFAWQTRNAQRIAPQIWRCHVLGGPWHWSLECELDPRNQQDSKGGRPGRTRHPQSSHGQRRSLQLQLRLGDQQTCRKWQVEQTERGWVCLVLGHQRVRCVVQGLEKSFDDFLEPSKLKTCSRKRHFIGNYYIYKLSTHFVLSSDEPL